MPYEACCPTACSTRRSGASRSIPWSSTRRTSGQWRASCSPRSACPFRHLQPEFVRTVLDAKPRQRLRWHYFMLWQMMGVEIWQELFTESDLCAACRRRGHHRYP